MMTFGKNRVRKYLAAAALSLAAVSSLHAAYIGYVYPAGGRQGSRVVLRFGGLDLYQVKNIEITGGGVNAVEVDIISGRSNVSGTQQRYVRRWLDKIWGGKDKTPPPKPEDTRTWGKGYYWDILDQLSPDLLEIVTRNVYIRRNSLQDSPALRQMVLVTIDIDKNAAPGEREIRLVGVNGISNPLPFFVGKDPEIKEPRFMPPKFKPATPVITFPSTVNGQIMPGESDRFYFDAKRGDKLTFSLKGRALSPFIGDGVPGHFQPVLEITDTKGKPLAFADDWYFDPDPRLFFKAPVSGRYVLIVRDALYRGREDFVYRVTARRGYLDPVKVPPPPSRFPLPLFKVEHRQSRKLPGAVMLAGRFTFDTPSYSFTFDAEAGKTLVFESFARRLGSPADTRLEISRNGKTLAVSDDLKGLRVGICYQQADSYIAFKAPETGEYTVTLSEVSGKGSGSHFFYLRAADILRPSFELYVTPSGISLPQWGYNTVNAYVVRHDGFNKDITVKVAKNDIAEAAGNCVIPAGVDQVKLTFYGKEVKKKHFFYNVPLKITGEGGGVKASAVGGDEMMQAFAYTHINPAKSIRAVRKWGAWGSKYLSDLKRVPAKLTISPGAPAVLEIRHSKLPEKTSFEFLLVDVPKGVTCSTEDLGSKFRLTLTASADTPKTVANAIIMAKCSGVEKRKDGKVRQKHSLFPLPAVRLEIK